MSALRWTAKSTETLAAALVAQGFTVSADTVGRLLKALGYSLQAPAKTNEGRQHPDRDSQFNWLNVTVTRRLAAGQPVISVDTKKKLLVGEKANGGREYQPQGVPERVDVHDFPDPKMGKVVPYGIYDVGADGGWVSVGDDGDTAVFAVGAIGRWWATMGKDRYPDATTLLITADAGGSNSYRTKLWKVELAGLAAATGLTITVCHYPPRHLQVEPHRAAHVLLHHQKLARPASHHLSHRGQIDRRHDHRHRSADRGGVGSRRLSHRHQGHESPTCRRAPPTPRLARRMELRHPPPQQNMNITLFCGAP